MPQTWPSATSYQPYRPDVYFLIKQLSTYLCTYGGIWTRCWTNPFNRCSLHAQILIQVPVWFPYQCWLYSSLDTIKGSSVAYMYNVGYTNTGRLSTWLSAVSCKIATLVFDCILHSEPVNVPSLDLHMYVRCRYYNNPPRTPIMIVLLDDVAYYISSLYHIYM